LVAAEVRAPTIGGTPDNRRGSRRRSWR
jgi:hypothetical protein